MRPSHENRMQALEKLEHQRKEHYEKMGKPVDARENRKWCEKIAEGTDKKPWGDKN